MERDEGDKDKEERDFGETYEEGGIKRERVQGMTDKKRGGFSRERDERGQ